MDFFLTTSASTFPCFQITSQMETLFLKGAYNFSAVLYLDVIYSDDNDVCGVTGSYIHTG